MMYFTVSPFESKSVHLVAARSITPLALEASPNATVLTDSERYPCYSHLTRPRRVGSIGADIDSHCPTTHAPSHPLTSSVERHPRIVTYGGPAASWTCRHLD